jgi:hypothetical protein
VCVAAAAAAATAATAGVHVRIYVRLCVHGNTVHSTAAVATAACEELLATATAALLLL